MTVLSVGRGGDLMATIRELIKELPEGWEFKGMPYRRPVCVSDEKPTPPQDKALAVDEAAFLIWEASR
jgi:hypothetical protein